MYLRAHLVATCILDKVIYDFFAMERSLLGQGFDI